MGTFELEEDYSKTTTELEEVKVRVSELEESNTKTQLELKKAQLSKEKLKELQRSIEHLTSQFILILVTLFAVIFTAITIYSFVVSLVPTIMESKNIEPTFSQLIIGTLIFLFSSVLIIQGIIYFLFAAYRQFILGDSDHIFKIKHPTLIIFISNLFLVIFLVFLM